MPMKQPGFNGKYPSFLFWLLFHFHVLNISPNAMVTSSFSHHLWSTPNTRILCPTSSALGFRNDDGPGQQISTNIPNKTGIADKHSLLWMVQKSG